MPLTQAMLPELLKIAARSSDQEQEASANRAQERLKNYLTEGSQKLSIQRLQEMMKSAPEGSGATVTPEGASYSRGFNPYQMQQRQTQGDAQARMKANQVYNSGLPKIQQVAQAASEGLDFANDPQNIGSLGQARTLMLKAMGMNR